MPEWEEYGDFLKRIDEFMADKKVISVSPIDIGDFLILYEEK